MAIILDTNDLLTAACTLLAPKDYHRLSNAVISAVDRVAQALAAAEAVKLSCTTFEPGFGGLCSTFRMGADGQTSDRLAEYDTDGDWGPPPSQGPAA